MKINQLIKVVSLALIIFTSCSDDNDNAPSFFTDVLVINEGNFLSAEGSISGYSSGFDSTRLDMYKDINGFAIGATVQRVEEFNGNYFMTTNNPDKVEMLNDDLKTMNAIITDLATPFSFAGSGNVGFVTNWGTYNSATYQFENPFISVVNMSDFTISSKIDWDFQPQDILVVGSNLYISNVNASNISIMDINTLEVTGSIETPFGPDKMELDAEGDIWVICTSGNLVEIDPSTNNIKKTIADVSTSGFNEKMVFNSSKDKIYWLSVSYDQYWAATTNVYELSTSDTGAPIEPLLSGSTFYGIGIDDDVLYVGSHNNYQGNGTVYMYDLEGNELGSFESGIVPNGFIFR